MNSMPFFFFFFFKKKKKKKKKKPRGEHMSFKERAHDISARYGEADLVTQAFLRKAMPYFSLAVARTKHSG